MGALRVDCSVCWYRAVSRVGVVPCLLWCHASYKSQEVWQSRPGWVYTVNPEAPVMCLQWQEG